MNTSLSSRYIKQSRMLDLMQRRSPSGQPLSFDITFVRRSDGAFETYRGCRLTSRHSQGGTINVMPQGENSPRKVRVCLITEFNNLQVYQ